MFNEYCEITLGNDVAYSDSNGKEFFNQPLLEKITSEIEKDKAIALSGASPGKYNLKDGDINKSINTNEDVLKHFEKYDTSNKIASWQESGKIKTESDFHYLDNENPERVAAVLNQEFKTDIEVKEHKPELSMDNEAIDSKIENDIEV